MYCSFENQQSDKTIKCLAVNIFKTLHKCIYASLRRKFQFFDFRFGAIWAEIAFA